MNEEVTKMGAIPTITETTVASQHCQGCGRINLALIQVAIRVSDTQQQSISWCNRCAGEVLDFLETRVLRVRQSEKGLRQANEGAKELLTEALEFEQLLFDYIASGVVIPTTTTTRGRIIATLEDWRHRTDQLLGGYPHRYTYRISMPQKE